MLLVLAWASAGRVAVAQAAASGPSVERLQGKPFFINLNCRRPPPPDAQVVRIDPPAEGWPAWSQSVLVLETPPGLVTIQRGRQARCGLSFDTRSS
ncbi:MAG: hypothetical protein ACOVKB_09760, partial [Silanimonas sp.]